MDYFKLFILCFACLGGFMATSYSYIADERGWPVGSYFRNGMSFPLIAGFICQIGSIVIAAIVNPWWSGLIVLAVGFLGNTIITPIFKSSSQYLSMILILASLVLVPLYIFNS